ncbi:MAG: DUF4347 domain-containing protein [Cyanobacteria bacterium P01_C01_bin.89]
MTAANNADFSAFPGLSTQSSPVIPALNTLNAAGLDLSPTELAGAAVFLQFNPSLAEATATLGQVWQPWLVNLGTIDDAAVPQWIDQNAPTLIDVALRQPVVRDALTGGVLDAVRTGLGDSDLLGGLSEELDAQLGAQGQGSRLVIIDGGVENYQQLIAGLEPGVEAIILDPTIDGVAQITAALAGRQNIASLHVLSHGDDASLNLGSTTLGLDNIDEYSALIQSWAPALKSGADLLLYGCNVGESFAGQSFLQQMRNLTTSDIAASDDLTGSALLGGDWNLEVELGQIDAGVAIAEPTRRNFMGTLDTISAVAGISGTADGGVTTSITALKATPGTDGISLEEAVIAANNTAGDDTIFLAPGGNYNIASTLTINDAGGDLTIAVGTEPTLNTNPLPNAQKATINGGGARRIFAHPNTGSFLNLYNLVITGGNSGAGDGGGILWQSAGGDLSIFHSRFSGNSGDFGGAIRTEGGLVTVTNSTFDNNTSASGGSVLSTNGTTASVFNQVTVTGNTTTAVGQGDIRINSNNSNFTTRNSIFDDTIAFADGGDLITSSVRNIFTTNGTVTGATFPGATADTTTFAGGSGTAVGNLTGQTPANVIEAGAMQGVFRLASSSPAINASTGTGSPATDQIGTATTGARRNIGATEVTAPSPTAPVVNIPGNAASTEDTSLVLSTLGALNVVDPDSDLRVTVSAQFFGTTTPAGTLDFTSAPANLAGDTVGTDGVLDFTATGVDMTTRTAALNTALQNLRYTPPTNYPTSGNNQINIVVTATEVAGGTPPFDTETFTLTYQGVADIPAVTAASGSASGTAGVAIALPTITATLQDTDGVESFVQPTDGTTANQIEIVAQVGSADATGVTLGGALSGVGTTASPWIVPVTPSGNTATAAGLTLTSTANQTITLTARARTREGATTSANGSGTVTVTVGPIVVPANQPPVLASTPVEETIGIFAEDAVSATGTVVSDFITNGSITDPDNVSAPEAIAITDINNNFGAWQFSINGGATWTPVPTTVSDTSAVLLDADDRVRFVPNANANGDTNIRFRAWDQTAGISGNTGINTAGAGAPGSPFSQASKNALLRISALNDAPTFTPGPNQTTNADLGVQTVPNWATNFVAGPADEVASQLLAAYNVAVTSNPSIFAVAPAIATDGTLTYTPSTAVIGATTATVQVSAQDTGPVGTGNINASLPQTFTITINPAGTPVAPVAVDDTATATQGIPLPINVIANDTDANNDIDPKTVIVTPATQGGSLAVDATTGQVFYTPRTTDPFPYTDTFQYTVRDNAGLTSNAATVQVTVNAAAPTLPPSGGTNPPLPPPPGPPIDPGPLPGTPPPFPLPAPGPAPAPAPTGGPDINILDPNGSAIDDGFVSLGLVPAGQVIPVNFTLENQGQQPLSIIEIRVPEGYRLANQFIPPIPPGESATLALELFASTVGNFTGPLEIITNDPDEASTVINLSSTTFTSLDNPIPAPPAPGTPPGTPGTPGTPPTDPGATPPPGTPPTVPGGGTPLSPFAPTEIVPAANALAYDLGISNGGSLVAQYFDEGFYLRNNPAAQQAIAQGIVPDAFTHFVQFGQFSGANPSALFDEALYLQQNPDVAALVGTQFISGFEHFLRAGQFEGRNPLVLIFDPAFYVAANGLQGQIDPGNIAGAFDHYRTIGQFQGFRPSEVFDEAFYLQTNPAAAAAVANGQFPSAFEYFVRVGLAAGQVPVAGFDPASYLAQNPDAQEGITAGRFRNAFDHFLRVGIPEGRPPFEGVFNAGFYISNNPQVQADLASGFAVNAWDHFIQIGQFQGLQPGPDYNEAFYLQNNPDVAAAIAAGSYQTGIDHFLDQGRTEGRPGNAS